MTDTSDSRCKATPERPWLGLARFTEAEHGYFFGRDREIRELRDRVIRGQLTVLYGISGYGKSSLLGAGLLPLLSKEFLPIKLPRFVFGDPTRSLLCQALEAIASALPAVNEGDARAIERTDSLWEVFHRRDIPCFDPEAAGSIRPVLIFDQFEDFFTQGEDKKGESARGAIAFLHDLADLVENRSPAALQEKMESEHNLVRFYDFQRRPVKVVLALREDFLSRLERWRRAMPSVVENRMELRRLSGCQAFQAIVGPGRLRCARSDIPPIVGDEAAAAIVRLAGGAPEGALLEEIQDVPTPLLSLLCEQLNAERFRPPEQAEVPLDWVRRDSVADEVLLKFYLESLASHPEALRRLVEDRLVSDGGHRETITLESAESELRSRGVPNPREHLIRLVDQRVLVMEDRGGVPRIELTHDVLATLALKSRKDREQRAALADPERIGPYRLVSEIGRGGLGVVYDAQDSRLNRRVALKVINANVASPDALVRFRREAEITSKLDHPGICTVYETGEDRDVVWIAMRRVEGPTLAQIIAGARIASGNDISSAIVVDEASRDSAPDETEHLRGPATWTEITKLLTLCEKTARTLAIAHEHGIVHRDIKPSNIIVTEDGDPVILDFGLARVLDTDQLSLTQTGDLVGTPAYMSPEQLAAERIQLDQRTDIYSLGASLYECLTLRRPFEAASRTLLYHAIMTEDAPDPRRMNDAIPRDLSVVIATALEKSRDRRYQTALAFAEDLRRVRAKEPIVARRVGPLRRIARWSRRNPAPSLTLAVLLAGIVIAMTLVISLETARRATETALRRSEGTRLLAAASASLPRDPALSLLLALEGTKYISDRPVLTNGPLGDAIGELRERRTLVGHGDVVATAEFSPDGLRAVTTSTNEIRVWDLQTGKTLRLLDHRRVSRATFTPDGRCLVARATDGTAYIWDAVNWTELASLGMALARGRDVSGPASRDGRQETGPVTALLRGPLPETRAVALSLDSRRMLTVWNRQAAVWDLESGKQIATLPAPIGDDTIFFMSPDGRRLLTFENDMARIWDADSGKETLNRGAKLWRGQPLLQPVVFTPDGNRVVVLLQDEHGRHGHIWDCEGERLTNIAGQIDGVLSMAFSNDGTRILSLTKDSIRVWNAATGEERTLCGPGPTKPNPSDLPATKAAFTRDGKRVVGASCDGRTHVWNAETGDETQLLGTQAAGLRSIHVSPDGSLVLTESLADTVSLWDSVRWTHLGDLRGHLRGITSVCFSPDCDLVMTASSDFTSRVWDTRTPFGAPILDGHQGPVDILSFASNGRLLVTASADGNPRVWRTQDGRQVAQLLGHKRQFDPQFSPNGSSALTVSEDGSATLFDPETGAAIVSLRGAKPFCLMNFSPDGQLIITASKEDPTVYVWNAATGLELSRIVGPEGSFLSVSFCGGGTRIATASTDRTVQLWDARSGEEIARMEGHRYEPPIVSSDGRLLAITATSGVHVHDATSGVELLRLPGDQHVVAFSPDGRRLVTIPLDASSFRIWEVGTGAESAALRPNAISMFHEFRSDGSLILTSERDGSVDVWDAYKGTCLHKLPGRGFPVLQAAFSPDGGSFVVSFPDDTRSYEVREAREQWVVPRHNGTIKVIRFSPDGRWLGVGYAGGVARLWPCNLMTKALEIKPRELTPAELDDYEIRRAGR